MCWILGLATVFTKVLERAFPEYQMAASIASPAVASGRIVIGADDGVVYAFGTKNAAGASQP